MIKKILIAFIVLIPFFGSAQIAVGDWKIHSIYGKNVTNVIDTKDKVYYLADNYLYSYDKADQVTESYTKRNKLSDIIIKNIYYNYSKKYLLIAYDNSNIDFMYDDGKIVNLPDIKDVILTSSKVIKDVTFNGDRAYVATEFGYVVINDKKIEVAESNILYKKVCSVAAIGQNLVLSDSTKIYVGDLNKIHTSLSSFTSTDINSIQKIVPIDDNSFFFTTGWSFKGNINADKTVSAQDLFHSIPLSIQPNDNGFYVQIKPTSTSSSVYVFDKTGTKTGQIDLPSSLQASRVSSYAGNNEFWAMDMKGIKNVKIENGTETIISDYSKPNTSSVRLPYNMVYNTAAKKLYVMNIGTTYYVKDYYTPATINTLDGSFWTDITPETSNITSDGGIVRDPYQPVIDPDDPELYYIGSFISGVYKIKGNKVVTVYDSSNSLLKFVSNFYCNVPSLQFDKNKNLWITQTQNTDTPVMVLPRAKQSAENPSASDWVSVKVNGLVPQKSMHMLITKKNDLKLFTDGTYESTLVVLNDNSTPDVASDDKVISYSSFLDQDEKSYDFDNINCFVEDANGKVWMGTTNGVVELNPANIFNSNFRINHLKVPRNDGTNYADYLLENQNVISMAVDGANRKWIGTDNAGIFLVSADGSQILKHFTTANSYLTDDNIISIVCNPNTNSVYIGTIYGLVEYSGDATPAEDNYDNVYAYPNPVRPDYTGYITVKGLVANSWVKIADSGGNVIYSGLSTGGMFTWDGRNASGDRVKTGVYFVLANSSENDNSKGKVVTKILIVN